MLMGTRQEQGCKEPEHLPLLDVPGFECSHVSFAVSLSLSLHLSICHFLQFSLAVFAFLPPFSCLPDSVSSSVCLCGQRLGPRPESGGGPHRTIGRG